MGDVIDLQAARERREKESQQLAALGVVVAVLVLAALRAKVVS